MRKNFGIAFDVDKASQVMHEMGLNFSRLAEKCGWDRHMVAELFKKGRCRPYTLEILATALELPISELMAEEDAYLKVKLDKGAVMPTRAHDTDAGLDLYSTETVNIAPGGFVSIDTCVRLAIPKNHVGLITSKSSLMLKGITSRGTIDSGYTGTIKAVMFNHSQNYVQIEKGQKITQLVILPIITPKPVLVENLEATCRGEGGFGSSGKF